MQPYCLDLDGRWPVAGGWPSSTGVCPARPAMRARSLRDATRDTSVCCGRAPPAGRGCARNAVTHAHRLQRRARHVPDARPPRRHTPPSRIQIELSLRTCSSTRAPVATGLACRQASIRHSRWGNNTNVSASACSVSPATVRDAGRGAERYVGAQHVVKRPVNLQHDGVHTPDNEEPRRSLRRTTPFGQGIRVGGLAGRDPTAYGRETRVLTQPSGGSSSTRRCCSCCL